MNSEQLQLTDWRIRLLLYPQYGAKPLDAIEQACQDSDLECTAPMRKYPSSYIHGAKKWLTIQVGQPNAIVIQRLLAIEDELSKRALALAS
jgi:hypothetical protein